MARVAVVGGGWGGLAAAVGATQAGHAVVLYEAARSLGGRARSLETPLPDGRRITLDNGQHILIGAYTRTLSLMAAVGVPPPSVLQAMPLRLLGPDGEGLALPDWPAPLDLAWGMATAGGWGWRDKLSLASAALRWRRAGFRRPTGEPVEALRAEVSPRVWRDVIEPLCVSALNTPTGQASADAFLRVLRDALLGPGWGRWRGSCLLLPRQPLGALFPQAAADWLAAHGARVRLGQRVTALARTPGGWRVDGNEVEAVVLACPSGDAVRLLQPLDEPPLDWIARARALRHEGIATVYATGGPALPLPLLTLRGGPAQFVFDRGQLGGPQGLLAFVVSASQGTREAIEQGVLAQARALGWEVAALRTVVEKRATFACTPGLERPGTAVAPGLWACADYVDGPYPATLEGAVRAADQVLADLNRRFAPAGCAAARTAR